MSPSDLIYFAGRRFEEDAGFAAIFRDTSQTEEWQGFEGPKVD